MNHALYFIREYDRCNTVSIKTLLEKIARKENRCVSDWVMEENVRRCSVGAYTVYFDVKEMPYDFTGLYAKRDCEKEWHFVSKIGGK
jgi:hypothetical protein